MICKVCGNEIVKGTLQCNQCTALVSDMREVAEKDMDRIPIWWLIGFATIPNLLLAVASACANSTEWYELTAFWVVLAFMLKIILLALDRRELTRRDRNVKGWTYLGVICAPVYIFFRDKISIPAIISLALWLICFCVFFFS